MRKSLSAAALLMTAVLATGCAGNGLSSLLDDRSAASVTPEVQSYQDLSMPPDLRLPPPGSATVAQSSATTEAPRTAAANSAVYGGSTQTAAAQPEGDVYERNGISKVHPDGTPKTSDELRAELKQVYLAKKRQANPSYGTIFNIGGLFDDG